MKAKKYTSIFVSLLITATALFGVYSQEVFAQAAGQAVSGKLWTTEICSPCQRLKLTDNYKKAVENGSLKSLDANFDEAFPGGNVPQLQLYDVKGNPVGSPIVGGGLKDGDAMSNALKGLANQPPTEPEKPQQHESLVVGTKYEYLNVQLGYFCADKAYILKSGYKTPPGKVLSDAKQCELAVNERKGRPAAVQLGSAMVGSGVYTVGECKENAAPGTPAKVKLKSLDENSFEACADDTNPEDGPAPGFDGLGDSPGSGNPGGPGGPLGDLLGGGAGILGALGPLMQMLGQGGQQGQQGQGQYGAGYGNQQPTCAQQPIAPVCGTDGKTYNNDCYRAQYTSLKNTGVCVATTPTPSPAPNRGRDAATIIKELSESGIPASILEEIRIRLTSVLTSTSSSSIIPETVVK